MSTWIMIAINIVWFMWFFSFLRFGNETGKLITLYASMGRLYKIPLIGRLTHIVGIVFTIFWFSYLIFS